MVAPNSPSERANANTVPATMPGNERGNVMVKKTHQGLAPSVLAASSNRVSTASSARRIARTIRGNAITEEASAAPRQLKLRPNHS
uniref:Uncharacterized protein n=1 Tax=Bracon brevicornis TaxID=1563983 RepID=A0A6V7KEK7_9HYME